MEVPQTLELKIDLNDTSGNQSMNPPVSSTPGEVLASNQNSPIIMPVVQETIAQSYVDQSMIPKGHSILAKGGGMSNAAVQYTNSRSFKNVYKDIGSLEPSELLQGLALGRGMSKGQSILNSGGGLSGMSLFKMEHYNPIDTTDNAIGGGEEKHDEDDDDTGDDDEYSYSSVSGVDTDEEKGTNPTTPTASKDLGTTFELTPEAKRKQIEDILKANYEVQRLHELTQAKKKADIEKRNKYLEIKKLKRKARDAKKAAMDAKKAASAKPITDDDDGDDTAISTDVTDEEKGTNPSTPELTPEARLKQIEEMLKAKKKAEIEKHHKDLEIKKLKRKAREAKKAASAKPTTDEDDDDDDDENTVTGDPTGDMEGLYILQRLATDANGNQLKDKKDVVYWGKYLNINNVKRAYIIQEKKGNEWRLVTGGLSTLLHNFPSVSKLTRHNDNTIFNNIGDSVIVDNFRITLWSKSMRFSHEKYYDKSNQ